MSFYMDVTAKHNAMNQKDRGPTPEAALAGDAAWAKRIIDATQCPECKAAPGAPCSGSREGSAWTHPARVMRYDNEKARNT